MSRRLARRAGRNPEHQAMAKARRSGSCPREVFSDYLKDNYLRGVWPMLKVGEKYFIETVTKYWTGKIVRMDGDWIELEDAAWVVSTGHFHDFIQNGVAEEVEPIEKGLAQYIPIDQVTAVTEWKHALLREVV